MKLSEITKAEFVTKLKDPFMSRVIAGVASVENMLANEWVFVMSPTYDHMVNDPAVKVGRGDPDVIVFKIRGIWDGGTSPSMIESDTWKTSDIIERVFGLGTDAARSRGENGEEIRTITVYVFESDNIKIIDHI